MRIDVCAADVSAPAKFVHPTLKSTLVRIDVCAANVKVDVSANLFTVDVSATFFFSFFCFFFVFFCFVFLYLFLSFFLFFPSKTKIVSNFLTMRLILILRVDLDR